MLNPFAWLSDMRRDAQCWREACAYRDSAMCRPFELVRELGIYVGLDFGLTPAALLTLQLGDYTRDECLLAAASAGLAPELIGPVGHVLWARTTRGKGTLAGAVSVLRAMLLHGGGSE